MTLECDYLALLAVAAVVDLGGWEAGWVVDASLVDYLAAVVEQHCCTCPYYCEDFGLSPVGSGKCVCISLRGKKLFLYQMNKSKIIPKT